MLAGEIVAIVTGVLGFVTAIATPFVRTAFDQCTKYLKPDEDVNLQPELRILQNIIQILQRKMGEVSVWDAFRKETIKINERRARLIKDAEDAIEIISRSGDIETWDCFGFCWCLADYRRSYLVGKYVSDVKRRVQTLTQELRSQGIDFNEAEVFGGEYARLVGEQAHKVVEKIERQIRRNFGIIGVYGPCGVGKTHVVRYVYEALKNSKTSVTFIWLEVSNGDDLLKLQMEVAKQIDLKLPNNGSVQENAKELKAALQRKKNILLVLDNMRKAISLGEIGFQVRILIVITSRSFAVCCDMKCDDEIALKPLSEDEAYEFLNDEIGITGFLLTEEIQFTLKKLAKECGGLPLAIVAVAKLLKKYFLYDHVVLTERSLKMEFAAFSNLKYIEKKIIQDLELTYEQLKHSSYGCPKECLLHCIMYPRNHAFAAMELMNNWMAEGLLREVEGIDEKLGEAKEILEELKDASLLESISYENGEEIVKMHPIVWDIVVKSEKQNPRFFTNPGCRIEKFAWTDLSQNIERVSLISNNLEELPLPSSVFNKLSTLLLQGNPLDIQLDRDFFNNFPNLKILDLSETRVRLLPESLSCLKHLNILLLRNCSHLTYLPLLSELQELMALDISNTSVEELPVGKNCLTKLLCLKLSGTRVRSLALLSELEALMVLDISGCLIAELPSLTKLVSLMILNVSSCPLTELPSLSGLRQLMVLDVSDCPIAKLPPGMNHLTKLLRLNLLRTEVRILPADLLAKFNYLQQLLLIGCVYFGRRGLPMQDGSAAWIDDVQNLECLSVLEVTFASLQLYNSYIASWHWRRLSSFKFCVGGLYRGELRNNSLAFIKEFPDGQNCLPDNTSDLLLMDCGNVTQLTIPKLSNLKFLEVSCCMSLKHLFTVSVIHKLRNLEEIVIAHCGNLVKLIEKDSSMIYSYSIYWPSLRKLTLLNLPELRFVYNGDGKSSSMEEIWIWNCPQLQKFPIPLQLDGEQNLIDPPSLNEIRGDESWLENLKLNSDPSVPFLEKTLIKEPPPEKLTSRSKMVIATSDMASSS